MSPRPPLSRLSQHQQGRPIRTAAGTKRPAPSSLPGLDPYAGDAGTSSGAPSDDDEDAHEDTAIDAAAVLAAVLPGATGPPGLAAPPDRDARWQDRHTRAKVDYVPPGVEHRDRRPQGGPSSSTVAERRGCDARSRPSTRPLPTGPT